MPGNIAFLSDGAIQPEAAWIVLAAPEDKVVTKPKFHEELARAGVLAMSGLVISEHTEAGAHADTSKREIGRQFRAVF